MERKTRRRLLAAALGLALVLAVLVLALPTLLTTAPARRWIERRLGAQVGRAVAIDAIEAGWGEGLGVRGLRIANAGPPFSDEPALELRRARLAQPLTDLLFGAAPRLVELEGLTLRIEERAGGRTNVDDLIERLTRPAPPPPPGTRPAPPPAAEPGPPPPPLRFALRDATIRVRRVPRRPPDRPVDPFREDVPVRPADEGAIEIALRDFDLELVTGAGGTRLTVAGDTRVQGRPGRLDGTLVVDANGVSGTLRAGGLDLALLDPLLPPRLAGVAELDVEGGTAPRLDLRARVTVRDFVLEGEGWTPIRDPELSLRARIVREPDALRIDDLRVEGASDAIALRGEGVVPLGEQQDDSRFSLRGHAPAELLRPWMAGYGGTGRVALEVDGETRGDRVEATASLRLASFRFDDERLRADGPAEWSLDGAGAVDLARRRLELRSLEVRGDGLALSVSGRADLRADGPVQLAGSLDVALDRWTRRLGPTPDVRASGRLRASRVTVARGADGALALSLDAELTDAALAAPAGGPLPPRDLTLSVRAHVDAGLRRIRLGPGTRLDSLSVTGELAGLGPDGPPRADLVVAGPLALDDDLLHALGAGARVRTDAPASVELALRGTAREFGVAGRVELASLVLRLDDGTVPLETLAVHGEVERRGAVWSGRGGIDADGHRLRVARCDWHATDGRLDARLSEVSVDALEQLPGRVPGLRLPPGLTLRGPLSGTVSLLVAPDERRVTAELASPRLTARWDGTGPEDERCTLAFTADRAGDTWRITDARVALPDADLRAGAIEATLAADGSRWSARGELRGSLGALARVVPALRPVRPEGTFVLRGRAGLGDEWTATADLDATALSLDLDGRRTQPVATRASVFARRDAGPGPWRCEEIELALPRASVRATATLGEAWTGSAVVEGSLAELGRFLPAARAEGDARVEANFRLARSPGAAPFRVDGLVRVPHASRDALSLRDLAGTFRFDGAWRDGRLDTLDGTVEVRASSAGSGDVLVRALQVEQTLRRRGGRGTFRGTVDAEELLVEARPVRGIAAQVEGDLDALVSGAPDTWTASGGFTFEESATAPLPLEEGRGSFVLRNGTLALRDVRGRSHGGTLTLDGTLRVGGALPAWNARVRCEGMRIDEQLGRPLSLIVPVLRVSPLRRDRALTGTLGAELDLAAEGLTTAALRRTLAGRGRVRLGDVAVTGSLLLPLLSLRPDRALPGAAYRFRDLDVSFRITDRRVVPADFELAGRPFGISVSGSAGLDGTLDFTVRPALLPVPLRVTGDWDDVKVIPAPLGIFR